MRAQCHLAFPCAWWRIQRRTRTNYECKYAIKHAPRLFVWRRNCLSWKRGFRLWRSRPIENSLRLKPGSRRFPQRLPSAQWFRTLTLRTLPERLAIFLSTADAMSYSIFGPAGAAHVWRTFRISKKPNRNIATVDLKSWEWIVKHSDRNKQSLVLPGRLRRVRVRSFAREA